MSIYLNFVSVSEFQCFVHVLLGDANKESIQRNIRKMQFMFIE